MKLESVMLTVLHESEGIGWKMINRIMRGGPLHEGMLSYSIQDWMDRGMNVEQANKLAKRFPTAVRSLLEAMSNDADGLVSGQEDVWKTPNRSKIRIVTVLDDGYPESLASISEPPWVLYMIGDAGLLRLPGIAMVGTRLPTAYGRKMTSQLTEGLARSGMVVVSGMARGIDGVAHEMSLKAGGATIAVLGSGIDVIYPPEHRSLYQEIAEKGLILSEYPPGTTARPGLFPRRNRIIAGLTLGTVVVEADARSGSLFTVDYALAAGRDVFAVPGNATSPKSRGTLALIKQGAKMTTEAQDILDEYKSWLPNRVLNTYNKEQQVPHQHGPGMDAGLTNDERRVYDMLEQGPGTLDELLARTQWDFGHLHSVLLSLIIKKQISQLPGAIYKII